jgi:uncharacterized protein YjbI with pentapeptide repeats
MGPLTYKGGSFPPELSIRRFDHEKKQVLPGCGIFPCKSLAAPPPEDRNSMRYFGILMATLTATFFLISPLWAQTPAQEYPWTGKTPDGKIIAKEELDRILADHKQWQATTGKEGQRAQLTGADLTMAKLNGANLSGADLQKAILSGADLRGADLSRANLREADLNEADLSGAYLFDADLSGAVLKDANLKDAILNKAILRDADLSGANLGLAGLSRADLRKSNLREANLNKTRLRANLHGANLWGANLIEADLRRANLRGANLSKADLEKANLVGADLNETNLSGAILKEADLRETYLVDAILLRADLRNVSLGRANLTRADLREVIFEPLPNSPPPLDGIVTARGLAELWYENYPQSLMKLRKAFKEAGYRQQEREIACSLKRSDTLQEWRQGGVARIKAALSLVFFDLTCNYGLALWRPLALLAGGVLLFFPFYCLALTSRRADTGIWLVWQPDRVLKGEGQEAPEKLTTTPRVGPRGPGGWAKVWWQLRRGWRILYLGFSVSLAASFSLGWKGLNAGSWISRLQKKEYTLRTTGWVRTLAGVQSLISAYLLILWVILAVTNLIE